MANGARFNVMWYEVDDFAVVGLHAGGPDLNRKVLRRHYRERLLHHVLPSQGRAALTSGPGVPTLEQLGTRVDRLLALDAARLRRFQHEWNRRGIQFSVQSWNPFAPPGSVAAHNPAGNPVGHRDSLSPCRRQTANIYVIQFLTAITPMYLLPLFPLALPSSL